MKITMSIGQLKKLVNDEKSDVQCQRNQFVCEMANKSKLETLLPMNIWIDEAQQYVDGRHSKRVKFQLDTSGKLHKNNLGSMDLNGVVRDPKTEGEIRELDAGDIRALRNFVHNNKYALEHVADMDIWLFQIWPDFIKGGELASEEEIATLNAKVDEIMAEQEDD